MAVEFSSALWPEGEQLSLMRAALRDGEEAVAAFHEWRERIIFDDLDPSSFRMMPLLRWNLNRLGVKDPLMARLDSVCRFLLVETTMKLDALRHLVESLRGMQVPCLMLKGAAIGQRYYPHPSLRPMVDCDLLIPFKQRKTSQEKLLAAGWRTVGDESADRHYSCDLWRAPFNTIHVELHWRSGAQSTVREDAMMWKASEELTFHGLPCRTFCAEDEIIHACRHGFNWEPHTPPMRWLADCAMIVRKAGERLDWEKLATRAARMEESLCVRRSLEWVRREAGDRVPQEGLEKLRAVRPGKRERRIYVLKGKPKGWGTKTVLLAEFLNREFPWWLWPLRPGRVLNYFAGQFALPDHADVIRYFIYRLREVAQAHGDGQWQYLLARLALWSGMRGISGTLLRGDFTGVIEQPSTLCWARRRVLLEGFAWANNGGPTGPLRVVRGGEVVDSVKHERIARADLAQGHPAKANVLHSGFAIVLDLLPGEDALVIEHREAGEWKPLFAVETGDFVIADEGVILPRKFPVAPWRIEFGHPSSERYLRKGWSVTEGVRRWSDGVRCGMIFGLREIRATTLAIKMQPLILPGKLDVQEMGMWVNHRKLAALEVRNPAPDIYCIEVPAEFLAWNNFLQIELPDAATPASLGLNADQRRLGICVEWMEFREVLPGRGAPWRREN